MRVLCESMLVPSASNWLDLLHVSDMINSTPLRLQVEGFLRDNFSVLQAEETEVHAGQSITQLLGIEYPGLLERVLDQRREVYPLPPSQVFIRKVADDVVKKAEVTLAPVFPIWALVLGVVACILYMKVQAIVSIGWVVPAINTAFISSAIIYGVLTLRQKEKELTNE